VNTLATNFFLTYMCVYVNICMDANTCIHEHSIDVCTFIFKHERTGKTRVTITVTGLSLRCCSSSSIFNKTLRWRDGSSRRVLLKMELELKHLKLNPVTVTVTPVQGQTSPRIQMYMYMYYVRAFVCLHEYVCICVCMYVCMCWYMHIAGGNTLLKANE